MPYLLSLSVMTPKKERRKPIKPLEISGPFKTLYRWKQLDFYYGSEHEKELAIELGEFVPENNLPLGIEVYEDRIFVAMPKWKDGVPATLGTIPRFPTEPSPKIVPYPNWEWNKSGILKTNINIYNQIYTHYINIYFFAGSCYGLISVYRMQADSCGRLWVIDSGQIDVAINPKQICPPTVYIFDLNTDELLLRYELPEEFIKQNSLYSNIIIDVRNQDCENAHAYITDVWRFGLVVFSLKRLTSWRIYDHLFFPDPLAAAYNLYDLEFEWTDGVFGVALSPVDRYKNDRILYYHPMSSFREFYSYASIVQNETGWTEIKDAFRVLGQSRGKYGQASASGMDRNGILFYNLVTRNTVGCWDSRKSYKRSTQGVVAYNNETMIFPNDLKIDQESRQSIWIITNKLPFFLYKKLDKNKYNFRIMSAYVDDAIRSNVCNPDFSYSDLYEYEENCEE